MKEKATTYYNNESVEITERIKKGQTILVKGICRETEIKAEGIAKEKRSYVFDVLAFNEKTGSKEYVGFGIPN